MSGKIIYHRDYNVRCYGIEKFHKFPADKYQRIMKKLQKSGLFEPDDFITPELDEDKIFRHLSDEYRERCQKPSWIAECIEIKLLKYIPYFLLKKHLCRPMMLATCGTITAAQAALEHGKAVNLSGGYHHASFDEGDGFCIYPDVPIAIKELREQKLFQRVAIIDLDGHQANGTEKCFQGDQDLLIADVYNEEIWPGDEIAKKYIDVPVPLLNGVKDAEYLKGVEENVFPAVQKFKPDIIFYNAGNDIYEKDHLTEIQISWKGIITRDKLVFSFAEENNIPIVMVLSGGYHPDSAAIIAESVVQHFGHKIHPSTSKVGSLKLSLQKA